MHYMQLYANLQAVRNVREGIADPEGERWNDVWTIKQRHSLGKGPGHIEGW